MKLKFLFLFLFLLYFFQSCNQPVIVANFNEPQPKDVKAIYSFPAKACGVYQSKNGLYTLTISQKNISKTFTYQIEMRKSELDSNYILEGDTLMTKTSDDKILVKIKNDTIRSEISYTDTLFSFSKNEVLKKFKGYFFLNKNEGSNEWSVQKLTISKGFAIISNIDSSGLSALKEITETSNDTLVHSFAPSKKQFKKLLHQDGFNSNDTFWRVRK